MDRPRLVRFVRIPVPLLLSRSTVSTIVDARAGEFFLFFPAPLRGRVEFPRQWPLRRRRCLRRPRIERRSLFPVSFIAEPVSSRDGLANRRIAATQRSRSVDRFYDGFRELSVSGIRPLHSGRRAVACFRSDIDNAVILAAPYRRQATPFPAARRHLKRSLDSRTTS